MSFCGSWWWRLKKNRKESRQEEVIWNASFETSNIAADELRTFPNAMSPPFTSKPVTKTGANKTSTVWHCIQLRHWEGVGWGGGVGNGKCSMVGIGGTVDILSGVPFWQHCFAASHFLQCVNMGGLEERRYLTVCLPSILWGVKVEGKRTQLTGICKCLSTSQHQLFLRVKQVRRRRRSGS